MSTATSSIGDGRALLAPMVLAKLIQAAQHHAAANTCSMSAAATGYSSAVLAQLAGSVVALEEDAGIGGQAQAALAASGAARVAVCKGR